MTERATVARVLLDTGPLVAIVNAKDSQHAACVAALHDIEPPLLTCWPVLTEAAWLLRSHPRAWEAVLTGIDRGLFDLLPLEAREAASIGDLMKRYRNLSLQLADAALIHLADRERIATVFTLDHRDFSVVRTRSKRKLKLFPSVK